ncbi:MAG: radical SAM protein [Deltaproteobacteria bacterium]|nr:radical SAM protein [Deltaproteobacteria bacterium]
MPGGLHINPALRDILPIRIKDALKILQSCTLCPRNCRVDRLGGEQGFCRTGRLARIASFGPHFGEEAPLVGRQGSGTIFFSSCNLLCSFCQNYDISHRNEGRDASPESLASIMIDLQERGCSNINFVTPTHVTAQIIEALAIAVERGLRIPLVYNCGGYESPATLRLLDGIVDIYLPDFKFWDNRFADRYLKVPDYRQRATEALKEMHRQVGDLSIDDNGIAIRGLLVRHLVMPEGIAGTAALMKFLAREISPATYVNIMDQYRPCGGAWEDATIGRSITVAEFEEALDAAFDAGIERIDGRRSRLKGL